MLFDYDTLQVMWWILVGVLLIGFALTNGMDMAVSALLFKVAKNSKERGAIISTISPHTFSNFSASTVDIENSRTKKQSSRFIRSAKVFIHAGEPFFASCRFFLATILHLRHHPPVHCHVQKEQGMTSASPL